MEDVYLKDLMESTRERLHPPTLSIQLQETRWALLYSNAEFAEKEIRKNTPSTTEEKGIKITKEVKASTTRTFCLKERN